MDIADEVARSLGIGDHRNLNMLPIRGMLGFGVLATGLVFPRRGMPAKGADVIYVVANPVAHGARLTAAVRDALSGIRIATISDTRNASVLVDVHAPGLSARSLRGTVDRSAVLRALRLRARTPRATIREISKSVVYREYVFLAQAVRYMMARDALEEVSESVVVLTDFDRAAYARPWVWAANERGLRTVTMVHGSPNANYVPALAKSVLAWGQAQVDFFTRHSPDSQVFIVGRLEYEARSQVPAAVGRIVICHSAESLSPSEAKRLMDAIGACRARGVESVVRLHPSVRAEALSGLWAHVARAADQVVATREPFIESLRPGDRVICITSTSAVEALISGFPVAVAADLDREVPVDLDPLRSIDLSQWIFGGKTPGFETIVALSGAPAAERLRSVIAGMLAQSV